MRSVALVLAAVALSGCATIIDGTTQPVTLTSNVDGAVCGISQNGRQIVAPMKVPVTHTLNRREGNLIVECSAEGYETTTLSMVTGRNPMAVTGNPLSWGTLIGGGGDAVLGGLAEYQSKAYVYMLKKPEA